VSESTCSIGQLEAGADETPLAELIEVAEAGLVEAVHGVGLVGDVVDEQVDLRVLARLPGEASVEQRVAVLPNRVALVEKDLADVGDAEVRDQRTEA